jgi:hypothetical protein
MVNLPKPLLGKERRYYLKNVRKTINEWLSPTTESSTCTESGMRKLLRELGFLFPYSLGREVDADSNAFALVALAFTVGLAGTNFPLSPVVKKNVNWVVSSFRLRGFATAGVATDF